MENVDLPIAPKVPFFTLWKLFFHGGKCLKIKMRPSYVSLRETTVLLIELLKVISGNELAEFPVVNLKT
ncbi:hypothetical protein DTL42_12490 [Bremerella cremea]|uniref:Uncharacterized protein n=1 Tax=Bremerella cremea TaxID=1031537 RepID=A0A368KR41_9BACT|nr:hypothetical protein DTL42_12490 [Bremerella cremea]